MNWNSATSIILTAPSGTESYLAVISVVLQLMQSNKFKTTVVAYDHLTSIWLDLLWHQADSIGLQHDWIIFNMDTIMHWDSQDNLADRKLNPEQLLNLFFYDMQTEAKLSSAIFRLNANDVRSNNIVVSDQPMDPKLILRRFVFTFQRMNLLNFAVLHVNENITNWYTFNPFEIGRIIEIAGNDSNIFDKLFFDKSKQMNGHQVILIESLGSGQLIRLHSAKQQSIMIKRNQHYSNLVANYFNVSVESIRLVNRNKSRRLNFTSNICEDTNRWQRYQ